MRATEKFSNTARFIAWVPSYGHRPHLQRKALHWFLLRYAKVFSTLLSDWLIFLSKKIIFRWSIKCAIDIVLQKNWRGLRRDFDRSRFGLVRNRTYRSDFDSSGSVNRKRVRGSGCDQSEPNLRTSSFRFNMAERVSMRRYGQKNNPHRNMQHNN